MSRQALTIQQVITIRKESRQNGGHKLVKDLAKEYDVSIDTITAVLHYRGTYAEGRVTAEEVKEGKTQTKKNQEEQLQFRSEIIEEYMIELLCKIVVVDSTNKRKGISTTVLAQVIQDCIREDLLDWQHRTIKGTETPDTEKQQKYIRLINGLKETTCNFELEVKRATQSINDISHMHLPQKLHTVKTRGICVYRELKTYVYINWRFTPEFLEGYKGFSQIVSYKGIRE